VGWWGGTWCLAFWWVVLSFPHFPTTKPFNIQVISCSKKQK
jgi:hypothetical protein